MTRTPTSAPQPQDPGTVVEPNATAAGLAAKLEQRRRREHLLLGVVILIGQIAATGAVFILGGRVGPPIAALLLVPIGLTVRNVIAALREVRRP